MSGRDAAVRAHAPQQPAAERTAATSAPPQGRRCLGAAAQLGAVHRTLRQGPAFQLKAGGAVLPAMPQRNAELGAHSSPALAEHPRPAGLARLDVVQRVIEKHQEPKAGESVIHHGHPDEMWEVVAKPGGESVRVANGPRKTWVIMGVDYDWSLARDKNAEFNFINQKKLKAEKWAILNYTQSHHLWINAKLRDPFLRLDQTAKDFLALAKKDHDIPSFEAVVEAIRSGIARLPVPKLPANSLPAPVDRLIGSSPVVSKGVNLTPTKEGVAPRYTLADHRVNRIFAVKDLNSTSFGTPFLSRDSLIFYKLPRGHSGRDISSVSSKKNENEVLFPPGLTYKTLARFDRGSDEFAAVVAHFQAEQSPVQHIIVVEVLGKEKAVKPTPFGFGSSEPRFKPKFSTRTGLHGYLR